MTRRAAAFTTTDVGPLVTLRPHIIEQIEFRRRTAAEIAEREAASMAQREIERATLPICVCCDKPKHPYDLIKKPDGTPSETCFRCVNFIAGWRGRVVANSQLARMNAINRQLRRECRYAK